MVFDVLKQILNISLKLFGKTYLSYLNFIGKKKTFCFCEEEKKWQGIKSVAKYANMAQFGS